MKFTTGLSEVTNSTPLGDLHTCHRLVSRNVLKYSARSRRLETNCVFMFFGSLPCRASSNPVAHGFRSKHQHPRCSVHGLRKLLHQLRIGGLLFKFVNYLEPHGRGVSTAVGCRA